MRIELSGLPSYSYPGMDVLESVRRRISRKERTTSEISRETGVPRWKVRAALSILTYLKVVSRTKRGRSITYKGRRASIRRAFLSDERIGKIIVAGVSDSKILRGESTRAKRLNYCLRMASDLGIVSRVGRRRSYRFTEEGSREVLGSLVRALLAGSKDGVISMSDLRRELGELGMSRELFDELMPRALSRFRLSPAPASVDSVRRDCLVDDRGRAIYFVGLR